MRNHCTIIYRVLSFCALYGGAFFLTLSVPALAAPGDLADVSSFNRLLDEPPEKLMQYSVTIANRNPEPIEQSAAAVYVLTQDEITRSGATSIPEALRLVPGMDVARVDAHTWAISSRGFNDVFANKLLVMIDGRTVYTPLFSGVFWDVQDTLMEDVDHIEVVRGPGATQWGANAVNGVINVVTKSATNTVGLLVSGGGGTEERDFGSVRYGLKLTDGVYMKAYAKWFDRDSSVFANDADSFDEWSMIRGGFRIDATKGNNNDFTLQGDAYSGQENEIYTIPTAAPPFAGFAKSIDNVAGANLLGRWNHDFGGDSHLTVQSYWDRTVRNNPVLSETRDTGDIDAQHTFKIGDRNELTWGAGFRSTHRDITRNSLNVTVLPDDKSHDLYSAFMQDQISITHDFKAILGTKFEHNDFTGFEIQPSARGEYSVRTNQTIWASVSRAVRTPSEAENDIRLNVAGIPPGAATIHGNPNMLAEALIAYEIGYRVTPIERLNLDLTAFYNSYTRLRSQDPFAPPFQTIAGNGLTGESYGGEAAVSVEAVPNVWRLRGGYSFLRMQIHRDSTGDQRTELMYEGSSPENQFFVHSSLDLPLNLKFDTTLRYVDRLRAVGIPSYVEVDARLAWQASKDLEVAVVGQNLIHDHHAEFAPTFIGTEQAEVERGVFGKLTFRY